MFRLNVYKTQSTSENVEKENRDINSVFGRTKI